MQSDHLRRRDFIALVGGAAAAWPVSARAQQPPARIGFLGSTSAARFGSRIEAFRSGLRDLGYVEGKTIVIAFRWADEKYDQLPALAAELVRENVDVIVTRDSGNACGEARNRGDSNRRPVYRRCRRRRGRCQPPATRGERHRSSYFLPSSCPSASSCSRRP